MKADRAVTGAGALAGVVVLAALSMWPAAVAFAQEREPAPGEVLLDEIGPGWAWGELCEALRSTANSPMACFERDNETLVIHENEVGTGADARDLVAVQRYPGDPLATAGLDAAVGYVSTDTPGVTTVVVVVATSDHVFTVILTSGRSAADAAPFAIDVAERQQEADGGPPPPSRPLGDEGRAAELDRLLITFPPESGLVVLDTATVRQSFDDLRPIAKTERVVDLLNGTPVRHRIFGVGPTPVLVVSLQEQPFSEFAATALGALQDTPQAVDRRPVAGLEHAVGFRFREGDWYGVAFRQGRYIVNVSVTAPDLGPAEAARLLDEVAVQQAALLPPGDTAPYFFPSTIRSMVFTMVCTTATCLLAAGVARVTARRRRRSTAQSVTDDRPRRGHVIDVSSTASALRRAGLVLLAGQVVAVNMVVIGVLALLGAIELATGVALAVLAGGLVGGVAFTSWRARAELGTGGGHGAPARGLWRSPLSVGGGIVAVALLVCGMAVAVSGLAGFAFGPSLSGLERSKALAIDPDVLDLLSVVVGVALLVCGALAVRLARTWSRTSAARVCARDRRPPILYLRSFDDDTLPLPAVVTARRPFLELFLLRGSDPFEEAVAWELAPYGPVVAIGRPGRPLPSLGAARDHLPHDDWQAAVSERMAEARAVAVVLGSSEGIGWEIGQLVATRSLAKTILLFPPTDSATLAERWRFTVDVLVAAGVLVPPLPADPPRVLTAVLVTGHEWRVTTSGVRDEASYRAAIDQSMAWLVDPRSMAQEQLLTG